MGYKMKIGIVILNYLNWKDTIECVESILNQSNQNFEIVIVDNNSNNESVEEFTKRYKNYEHIHILETYENLGFAKGNNTGIVYCKDVLKLNNVFVTNNDVIFTDKTYFERLTAKEYSSNIGAVGTVINGSDGINQNPIILQINLYTLIKHYLEPLLKQIGLSSFLEKMHRLSLSIKNKFGKGNHSQNNFNGDSKFSYSEKKYFLHGSAIFFTENYLKHVDGFYPHTFLYYEENILAIVFEKMGLEMFYDNKLEMYHKEDQSMAQSFKDVSKAKRQWQRRSIISAIKVRLSKQEAIKRQFKNIKYEYNLH